MRSGHGTLVAGEVYPSFGRFCEKPPVYSPGASSCMGGAWGSSMAHPTHRPTPEVRHDRDGYPR